MKLALAFVLIALFSVVGLAQNTSAETDFEKNKSKFTLEKFAEGEDASSGYDYLVYKNKTEIVKIREIWSSSAVSTYRAEDYYFAGGKLIALVKYTFAKRYYNSAKKGNNIPLSLVEKLYLTDSKLTTWIEKGKTVPTTDARWKDKEKEILEAADGQLETYKRLKEEN